MNPHLDFLLSELYNADPLIAPHLADLHASALTDGTIARQKFRTVPPMMLPQLLGFDVPAVRSAYLLPFPDPHGGWIDHVRLKVFPPHEDARGQTVKYLQPKRSGVRLYFPLATLDTVLHSDAPLWCCEGEKKSLAVAQLDLASVGFAGIDAWHVAGERTLLSDFDVIPLRGRLVELVPDGDVRTNPNVEWGAFRFAEALEARGARVRLVVLPVEMSA